MEDVYRSQFRLPNELYEQLRVAAHQEGRSLNAEVVARLQQSFVVEHDRTAISEPDVKKLLGDMQRAIDQRFANVERGLRQYVDDALRGARGTGAKKPGRTQR